MSYDEELKTEKNEDRPPHYYGHIVRKFLLINSALMLIEYPFFSTFIALPYFLGIGAAIVLVILAGFQNPRLERLSEINTGVCVFGCFIFAYTGMRHYLNATIFDPWFFWSNQLHALLFLIAIYYSSKTIRSEILQKIKR